MFAKKSHNVINIISAISAIGMAIGVAALVIIMSIYNGFDSLVEGMMSSVEPDLMISPTEGKVFVPEEKVYDWIYDQASVGSMCTTLEDQVFIDYDGSQTVATAKGVDEIYQEESPLRDYIREGEYSFHLGELPCALVGAGLANTLELSPRFVASMKLFLPSRTGNISIFDPLSSLNMVRLKPSATFAVSADIDEKYIFLPIETMRELLEYSSGEVSAVEIRFAKDASPKERARVQKGIAERLPEGLAVKDRYQQNESLYKMMKYEKAAIFLILIFVIIIIAFNIFGSLSMLIIDKKQDIATLRSLGAGDRTIRRIFTLEGWMVSLLGLAAGLFVGIAFALLQQKFGFIPMPGGFAVSAYPIVLSWKDILTTIAGVSLVGYLIALLPTFRREIL